MYYDTCDVRTCKFLLCMLQHEGRWLWWCHLEMFQHCWLVSITLQPVCIFYHFHTCGTATSLSCSPLKGLHDSPTFVNSTHCPKVAYKDVRRGRGVFSWCRFLLGALEQYWSSSQSHRLLHCTQVYPFPSFLLIIQKRWVNGEHLRSMEQQRLDTRDLWSHFL